MSYAVLFALLSLLLSGGNDIVFKIYSTSGDRGNNMKGQGFMLKMSEEVQPSGNKEGKMSRRSEERRVGKECRSRWSPYH